MALKFIYKTKAQRRKILRNIALSKKKGNGKG